MKKRPRKTPAVAEADPQAALEQLTARVAAAARAVTEPSGHQVIVIVVEPTLGKWQANWGQLPSGFVGWIFFKLMNAIDRQG